MFLSMRLILAILFTLGVLVLVSFLPCLSASDPFQAFASPIPHNAQSPSLQERWQTSGNNYSTVFLHGILGWGEQKPLFSVFNYWGGLPENILDHLRAEGHSVVAPSMGAVSSCWERACEAFAQLTGDITDYGIARSTQFNHSQFGEDWRGKAMLPDFKAAFHGGPFTKINIVGHSQGGQTGRFLAHLLRYGSQEEMNACEKAGTQCSPLFWTNKTQSFVNSVFSVSGVHQGSVVVDALKSSGGIMQLLKDVVYFILGLNNVDNTDWIWDLQLGHWGLSQEAGENFFDYLDRVFQSPWFSSKSNSLFDLGVGSLDDPLLSFVQNAPDVTYFSLSGVSSKPFFGGYFLAEVSTTLLLAPFADLIGFYSNSNLPILGTFTTKDWRQSDGMVMVASTRGPTAGFQDFHIPVSTSTSMIDLVSSSPAQPPAKGVYNWVGTADHTDHLQLVGWTDLSKGQRNNLYSNIMAVVRAVSA